MSWVKLSEPSHSNDSHELIKHIGKFEALEDRVIRNEEEIEKIESQIAAGKRFMLTLAVTALTGIASIVTPMVVAYLKN
jgi:hypothetical protein